METVSIHAKDGVIISALTIGLDGNTAKAAIIICHGFGEHSGCYVELAERLHKSGFACIIHNQRGHGLPPVNSKNWHGRIPSYQCFLDDVIVLSDYIREKLPDTPIVLYGHSMGGNIVINTLLRIPKEKTSMFACAVLEAPWLGLYKTPNVITVITVRLLNVLMPNFRILNKLSYDDLSTIAERADGYAKDPLYHGYLSARMIVGIFDACEYALKNAGRFPIRAYLASASGDVVVCNKTIAAFAVKAGDAITSKEYESNHAIHNDINREAYLDDIINYIYSQIPS